MGEYIHSTQARFDKSHVSCGLLEMHHLPKQSANKTVFALANNLYNKANPRPSAYVLCSDVVSDEDKSRGQLLAAEITKLKVCGDLLETKKEVNPKSGNVIKVGTGQITTAKEMVHMFNAWAKPKFDKELKYEIGPIRPYDCGWLRCDQPYLNIFKKPTSIITSLFDELNTLSRKVYDIP